MRLGILAAGITPDELLVEHGSYAQMIMALLDKTDSGYSFEVYDVRDNHFPENGEQCDGWIISGSKYSVYECAPWMLKLKELIKEIHRAKRPLVGICFGHQIIAEAFGGKVEKYEEGWGLGLHTYQLLDGSNFIQKPNETFTLNAVHQDQVVLKPECAEVFAASKFCQYAGLVYGDLIISLQAHPEFDVKFEADLLSLRRGDTFPEDVTQSALKALGDVDVKTDQTKVASWLSNFLNKHQ